MAYSIMQSNGNYANNYVEYSCDTVADLETLPKTSPLRSFALVVDTSDVYILNSKYVWVKL